MTDRKQVEIEVEIDITVPVKLTVEVDLDDLRAGAGLLDASRTVRVAPVYKVLTPEDIDGDADIDWDAFSDAVDDELALYGIDVGELQAESECDCGDECEGCDDCDCEDDEDSDDEGDDA